MLIMMIYLDHVKWILLVAILVQIQCTQVCFDKINILLYIGIVVYATNLVSSIFQAMLLIKVAKSISCFS
jgi:cell division protein FtsL